jgi:hypothetical protein
LRGDAFRGGWGFPGILSGRGGDYRCLVRGRDMDCAKAAHRDPRGTCFTAEPAKLKVDDKTAID